MIYQYTLSGFATGTDTTLNLTPNAIVDTDSVAFKRAVTWVCMQCGGLEYPDEQPYDRIHDGFAPVKGLNLLFKSKTDKDKTTVVDAFLLFSSPKVAAIEVAEHLVPGTQLDKIPEYNTKPYVPPQDWELAGSPIGQPLGGKPGCYQFKYTQNKEGDIILGPVSGKPYRLENVATSSVGVAFMSRYLAWRLLA